MKTPLIALDSLARDIPLSFFSARRNKALLGWLFVLPPLAIYAIFFMIPFFQAIYISFTDWNGASKVVNWVGLENYARLVKDPLVWKALSHNGIWVVVGTIAPVVIGLGLAMLLWPRTRGRVFSKRLISCPKSSQQ